MSFGFWLMIFDCFVAFHKLAAVFGCSWFYVTDYILTDSISTLFGFSTDSACRIIIFDCVIGFDNL